MTERSSGPGDDAPPEHRESLNLRLRMRQAPNVVRRAVRNPSWLLENARLLRLRRAEANRRVDLTKYSDWVADEWSAVAGALGVSREDYEAARDAFWAPEPDPTEARAIWDARRSLQSLVSVAVRLVRPDVMVETGVARGYTTAIALAAMEEAKRGHLYSVDLPALEYEGRVPVGDVVPESLKARWTLTAGPSRSVLPRVVKQVAPIDIFLHDSDHTYSVQLEEYDTVWPYLRSGGVLLSDDIQNDALIDFATKKRVTPFLVGATEAASAIGLLCKP